MGGSSAGLLQQLAVADDGVQRRAQFVAHGGQKAAFGGVGRLRGLLRYQRGAQMLHHGVECLGQAAHFVGARDFRPAAEIAVGHPAGEFGEGLQRAQQGAQLQGLRHRGEQQAGARQWPP